MAKITVACPSCGKAGRVSEATAAGTVRCPGCGFRFTPGTTAGGELGIRVEIEPPTQSPPTAVRVYPAPAPRPETPSTRECPYCGEAILPQAKKCKHCGELVDPALRAAEDARRTAEAALAARQPVAPVVHQSVIVKTETHHTSQHVVKKTWYRSRAQSCLGCLGLLLIAGFVAIMIPAVDSARQAGREAAEKGQAGQAAPLPQVVPPPAVAPPHPVVIGPPAARLMPGAAVVFRSNREEAAYVEVAVDEASFQSMLHDGAAARIRLRKIGKILHVKDGTAGELVEVDNLQAQVRISGGPSSGREVWVSSEEIRAAGSDE